MKGAMLASWTIVIGISGALLIAGGRSYNAASTRAQHVDQHVRTALRQSSELATLQAELPTWTRQAPSAGLAPRISDSLAACGLPAAVMQNLATQPGVSVGGLPGTVIKRRVASVTLSPVTLPELGKFLESWRAREPGWLLTTIDLTPLPAPRDARDSSACIRAVLSIEALSVEPTGPTP